MDDAKPLVKNGTRFFSQGSVATRLRCGGIFKSNFNTHLPLRLGMKLMTLKIGQQLAKMQIRV